MDFAAAFSFVFDDQDWLQKIIIGGLLGLIPVVGPFIALGYMVAIARNVIRHEPHPLPDWANLGQMIIDGLYMFAISLIYTLPILLIFCLAIMPMFIVGGAADADADDDGGGAVGAVISLGVCCVWLLIISYIIIIFWFFFPVAIARYADTGEMSAALQFGEILAITRANPVVFFMALLIAAVAITIASFGMIACIVGVWFTNFYAQCVIGHAYGQAYLAAAQTNSDLTVVMD